MGEREVWLYSVLLVICLTFSRAASRARFFIESFTMSGSDNQPVRGKKHLRNPAADTTGYMRQVKLPILELQCERCHGCRSASYHIKHYKDPVAFPRIGICSRRRTNCARVKSARCEVSRGSLPVLYELPANEAADQIGG